MVTVGTGISEDGNNTLYTIAPKTGSSSKLANYNVNYEIT